MHNRKPLVSVIMPVFNAAETIIEAIDSVRNQSFDNWELIVVDDCSSDETAELVTKVANSEDRIILIRRNRPSGSPAQPRNEAISAARGRYIAFLDADDKWDGHKLGSQIKFMQKHNAVLSCTGYRVVNNYGDILGKFMPPLTQNYRGMLRLNTIGCLTAMYDSVSLGKRYFKRIGHEDYALWLSIIREGYYAYGLQDVCATYRISKGSVSSNKIKSLVYYWNIYRNIEGYSLLKSSFYSIRYAFNAIRRYR